MVKQKLTLYQHPLCPYAQRALMAAEITKQEIEKVFIDVTIPREEWYLKINPYGQVPALKIEGDDFVILESPIVAQYIAELNPESNYIVYHYMNRLQPAHGKLTFTLDKSQREANSIEYLKQLELFNGWLEKATRKRPGPFIHGEHFTLADLNLAPFVVYHILTDIYQEGYKSPTIDTHPHLKRYFEWNDAVVAHPAVVAITASKEVLVESLRKYIK
ncbi:hypothetical protein DFQ26_004611 [Actinomortierella ambigua]|nr:hypothetical protein DFQ26_004611 [Actinomortierella ambigua]